MNTQSDLSRYKCLKHTFMIRKTQCCNHSNGCLYNCVRGGFESFLKAFFAKLCLNIVFTLLQIRKIIKGKKILTKIFQSLINKSNVQLGLFVGLQTFLLKAIQCLMREVRKKDDGWNSFISGAISGRISIMLLEDRVKYNVRIYLFGRAVDCLYQSLIQRGIIRDSQLTQQFVFTLCSMVISYAYFFEPEMLAMDTYKLYENFSQVNMNDKIWHMANIQSVRNKLAMRGIS